MADMGIFRRKPPTSPLPAREELLADIEVAQAKKAEASEQYRKTLIQGFDIARMAAYFAARRERNGFGDSIEISFKPKEKHAS